VTARTQAAIYVRTSTQDQDGAGQLHECLRAAVARGWCDREAAEWLTVRVTGVEGYRLTEEKGLAVYRDRGESGAKASRPAWDKLRADIRAGIVRRVMVESLSRFGRKLGQLILDLDDLHRQGCELVILREGIDYGSPGGRMIAGIFGALAEYEREQSNARTRSKLQALKASGVKLGRPERSVDAERAAELYGKHRSWRTVARCMGVPMSTLRRAVKRAT